MVLGVAKGYPTLMRSADALKSGLLEYSCVKEDQAFPIHLFGSREAIRLRHPGQRWKCVVECSDQAMD